MGRKSQSKQTSKKTSGKENNKFVLQKRKELVILVDKVLRLTSVFEATTNIAKSWEHHLEIDAILKEIINLEYPQIKSSQTYRQNSIDNYLKWLKENEVKFEGVEIAEFEGYDLGLKATKYFPEGSLILTVPAKVMMTEKHAKESELSAFISVDPLLQSMPNITLALFLLLQKSNPDSFWKPYIDSLPEKYSTILYFSAEELSELRPSPVFESSLKLFRSIARQYAYFHNKIHTLDIPVLKKLQDIFTFDNYRWAVSTVMTRQNNIVLDGAEVTAFIPLWDMCNHEHGKITTEYNAALERGECCALRDFKPGEQIFIHYGSRPNADLFLHNGFVYCNNPHDRLAVWLGVGARDPLHAARAALLARLGLPAAARRMLHRAAPLSAELRAFSRVFSMEREELAEWCARGSAGGLVAEAGVGAALERRALGYLRTRCRLVRAGYAPVGEPAGESSHPHRKNIQMLKESEVQILEGAIQYLTEAMDALPAAAQP